MEQTSAGLAEEARWRIDGHLVKIPGPVKQGESTGVAPTDGIGSLHLAARAWTALRICSFTASRLKLAPFCIGGNSTAVIASFST